MSETCPTCKRDRIHSYPQSPMGDIASNDSRCNDPFHTQPPSEDEERFDRMLQDYAGANWHRGRIGAACCCDEERAERKAIVDRITARAG